MNFTLTQRPAARLRCMYRGPRRRLRWLLPLSRMIMTYKLYHVGAMTTTPASRRHQPTSTALRGSLLASRNACVTYQHHDAQRHQPSAFVKPVTANGSRTRRQSSSMTTPGGLSRMTWTSKTKFCRLMADRRLPAIAPTDSAARIECSRVDSRRSRPDRSSITMASARTGERLRRRIIWDFEECSQMAVGSG